MGAHARPGAGRAAGALLALLLAGPAGAEGPVAAGASHVCALRADGRVACAGSNFAGQLGGPELGPSPGPVQVPNLTGVAALASGPELTCARLHDRRVFCWGAWQVELNAPGHGPVHVAGADGADQLSVGANSACVVASGQVRCWGRNTFGQLGAPGPAREQAQPVPDLEGVVEVSVGGAGACARLASGAVRCWGRTHDPPASLGAVQSLSAGEEHACAVAEGQPGACWGHVANAGRGRGPPAPGDRSYDSTVLDDSQGARELQVHAGSGCARWPDGALRCWGDDFRESAHVGGQVELRLPAGPWTLAWGSGLGNGRVLVLSGGQVVDDLGHTQLQPDAAPDHLEVTSEPLQPWLSLPAEAGLALSGAGGSRPGASLALIGRGELLLGRGSLHNGALGAYGEALTDARLARLELGGGAAWVPPNDHNLRPTLTLGGYAARPEGGAWAPGVATGLSYGLRGGFSQSLLDLPAGLRLEGRLGLGAGHPWSVILGLEADVLWPPAGLCALCAQLGRPWG